MSRCQLSYGGHPSESRKIARQILHDSSHHIAMHCLFSFTINYNKTSILLYLLHLCCSDSLSAHALKAGYWNSLFVCQLAAARKQARSFQRKRRERDKFRNSDGDAHKHMNFKYTLDIVRSFCLSDRSRHAQCCVSGLPSWAADQSCAVTGIGGIVTSHQS